MLTVILAFVSAGFAVPLDDIACAIASGNQVFHSRISSLARTWLQLVPHCHIYTDDANSTDIQSIVNQTSHLNLTFHILHSRSHALVGTKHDDAWNHAQDRYMSVISDLFEREPTKSWYFFCDDDTFVYPSGIVAFLSDKTHNESVLYGRLYQPWLESMVFYKNGTDWTVMAQGGAGFLVSRPLADEIKANLTFCREIYMSANLPSSTRLSLCLERFLGSARTLQTQIYRHDEWSFHHDSHLASLPRWNTSWPYLSFHHIVPPMADELWNASVSVFENRYWDWSAVTLACFAAEIGEHNRVMEVMWGYRLCESASAFGEMERTKNYRRSGNFSRAVSGPVPVFDGDGPEPAWFDQEFDGGITLRYRCDGRLNSGVVRFGHHLDDRYGTEFRVKCPPAQPFLHNHPGGESPLVVMEEEPPPIV
jgi:hypothetical protein